MPNTLFIDLESRMIRPGQTLAGEILWEFDTRPDSIHLGLGWWTTGRGDRDEAIIAEKEWPHPQIVGKEAFELRIPERVVPSFSGRLISVVWGVQVAVKGVKIDDVIETLTLSPMGKEIDISGETYQSKAKSVSIRKTRRLPVSN